MYSAYHFCVLFDSPDQGGGGFTCTDWRWYAMLLLNSGELDSQLIIPQIACFVVSEDIRIKDFTYSFKFEFAQEFFDNELKNLMQLLSKEIDYNHLDSREIKMIQTAREFALTWLTEYVT